MIEQSNSFNLLSNGKNLVLSNGSEHVQNVIKWYKNGFFSKKLHILYQARSQDLEKGGAISKE